MDVLVDLFPCSLQLPDRNWPRARLIAADGRALVFATVPAAQATAAPVVALIAAGDLLEVVGVGGGAQDVRLADGSVWVAQPTGSCRCGPLARTPVEDLLVLAGTVA